MGYVKSCSILGAVFAFSYYLNPTPTAEGLAYPGLQAAILWGILTLLGFPIWGIANLAGRFNRWRAAARHDKAE